MNNTKRILIVTHQFIPHQSPRTTRWKLLYDELIESGYDVTVITGTLQLSEDPNIKYIGNKKASGIVKNLRIQSNIKQDSRYKNYLYKLLKKIYRFFYKFFAWPDYTMFWIFSIWKNRKKIDIDYDLIISVSLPFSSHVAAYIINKDKNKKWIMDIGDPFSLKTNAFENNRYLYKSLNYYFENKFYKKAHQVVFTHQESADEHKIFFNMPENKVTIGSPISTFSQELFQKSVSFNYETKPITIGYFGVLTKGVRSPSQVLKFFQQTDFVLHWYTNSDSKEMIKQNKIDFNRNKLFDMVTRNEALEKMVTSLHCLLSIGNLNPAQLPSKIIEYISTGKPVLHFVEIKDDPVLEIAKEFSNLIVIDKNSNITEVEQQLNNVFINIEKFDINKFNENYSTRAVTNKLNII
tara:strand:- start:2028 stop:3248 length:1221 start_codon:yes stop_codon:yes gene_type:complete